MVRTWQIAHPMAVNKLLPAWASAVAASTGSRGGALVALMKLANAATSVPSFSGSATPSLTATPLTTVLPLDVLSLGCSGLVMPISLR